MKRTQKEIEKMYKFTKDLYDGDCIDIYEMKRLYNDICEEFDMDIEFGIDGCEYGGDEELYCYVYVNNIGSIVFNRGVKRYTDEKFYKDTVNYLLKLEEEAHEIVKKIENLENENKNLKAQLKEAKEYLHSNFSF